MNSIWDFTAFADRTALLAGPEGMLSNLQRMVSCAAVPVLAKPNAGKPQIVDGMTVYPAVPEAFAEAGKKLAEAGARFLGGCCGTTPEHIRQLAEALQNVEPLPVSEETGCMLASERETIEIQAEDADCILGDQIDPADDEVQEAFRDEDMDTILDLAQDQADEEVSVLNLCTALEGVDEKGLMTSAIDEVTQMISCALSVETADPEVLEAALRRYAGRALVNVSGLKEEEIRGLLEHGVPAERLIAYGLEYKFVTLYLQGELPYAEMREKLAIAIHQFAKRQMTWFRGMERSGIRIHWVDPASRA